MDVWAWVERLVKDLEKAGQGRAVELIYQISHYVHINQAHLVEGLVQEGLAIARALGNPWLEIFFRHWNLQNRTRNLAQGAAALLEATALLEFSHREDTVQCPQSVCTTQDMAICYRNMDGPGWAEARKEVCAETLARITPKWQCFDCISREYADALIDQNRAAEAVDYLHKQQQQMLEHGQTDGVAFKCTIALALCHAREFSKALALLDEIDALNAPDDDEGDRLSRRLLRAKIFLDSGRLEEAWATLPAWGPMIVPGLYDRWIEVFCGTVALHPEENHWHRGRVIQNALDEVLNAGSYRWAVQIAIRHGHLALDRHAPWTASLALQSAKTAQAKLQIDAGAENLVAGLQNRLADYRAPHDLITSSTLLDDLAAQPERNPEAEIERLLTACSEQANDIALHRAAARAMSACNAHLPARQFLWQFVQRQSAIPHAAIEELLNTLLQAERKSNVDSEFALLLRYMAAEHPEFADWVAICRAYERERWAEVVQHAPNYISQKPALGEAHRLWAYAAMQLQDFATALSLYEQLATANDAPGNDDWDALTAASAAQNWPAARAACQRLGISLRSEHGVIEEDSYGLVRVRFLDNGEFIDHLAQRTGPVTARVIGVAAPTSVQHVDDWVVFDAEPLEAPETDAESDEDVDWAGLTSFRAVYVLKHGGQKSWFFDGAHPGPERWQPFMAQLEARNWRLEIQSFDGYTVTDSHTNTEIPGVYFWVCAPVLTSARQLDATFTELTADWPHPLCWHNLAATAGSNVDLHEAIRERYGL